MGIGALTIVLVKYPLGDWVYESEDRSIGLQIGDDDCYDLFFNILKVPESEPDIEGTPFAEREKSRKDAFREDLRKKGFPLLGRIDDIYQDATFTQSEIDDLRNECLSLSSSAQAFRPARVALDALIFACNEAQKSGLGIILSSD